MWVDKSRELKLVIYCCFTEEPGRGDEGKTGDRFRTHRHRSKARKRYGFSFQTFWTSEEVLSEELVRHF